MTGRKGIARGTSGAWNLGGVFDAIYSRRKQCGREGVRDKHPSPRTSSFHASRFQSESGHKRNILQVVVIMVAKGRDIGVTQAAEMVVITFHDQSADDKWYADIGHLERFALDDLVGQELCLIMEIVIQVTGAVCRWLLCHCLYGDKG